MSTVMMLGLLARNSRQRSATSLDIISLLQCRQSEKAHDYDAMVISHHVTRRMTSKKCACMWKGGRHRNIFRIRDSTCREVKKQKAEGYGKEGGDKREEGQQQGYKWGQQSYEGGAIREHGA